MLARMLARYSVWKSSEKTAALHTNKSLLGCTMCNILNETTWISLYPFLALWALLTTKIFHFFIFIQERKIIN